MPETATNLRSRRRREVGRSGRSGRVVRKKPARKTTAKKAEAKSRMLNLRADETTTAIIDRAAEAVGLSRTDFMLTSAREKATEVLLNRRQFFLSGADWTAFVDALDNPPPPNAKLKALLAEKPVWERNPR